MFFLRSHVRPWSAMSWAACYCACKPSRRRQDRQQVPPCNLQVASASARRVEITLLHGPFGHKLVSFNASSLSPMGNLMMHLIYCSCVHTPDVSGVAIFGHTSKAASQESQILRAAARSTITAPCGFLLEPRWYPARPPSQSRCSLVQQIVSSRSPVASFNQ